MISFFFSSSAGRTILIDWKTPSVIAPLPLKHRGLSLYLKTIPKQNQRRLCHAYRQTKIINKMVVRVVVVAVAVTMSKRRHIRSRCNSAERRELPGSGMSFKLFSLTIERCF